MKRLVFVSIVIVFGICQIRNEAFLQIPSLDSSSLPNDSKHIFILFYSQICGESCEEVMSVYTEIFRELEDIRPDIIMLKMEGPRNLKLLKKFPEVNSYPVIIYVAPGTTEMKEEYSGEAEIRKIREWMSNMSETILYLRDLKGDNQSIEQALDKLDAALEIAQATNSSQVNINSAELISLIREVSNEVVDLREVSLDIRTQLTILSNIVSKMQNNITATLEQSKPKPPSVGRCGTFCKSFFFVAGILVGLLIFYILRRKQLRRIKQKATV